jgi:hypothetical protein
MHRLTMYGSSGRPWPRRPECRTYGPDLPLDMPEGILGDRKPKACHRGGLGMTGTCHHHLWSV